MRVRAATRDDIAHVAAIYGSYVRDSYATFDLTPPPAGHWRDWFAARVEGGPYALVVAEDAEGIRGYAKSDAFREKAAYAPSIMVSVYCARDAVGRGLGTALYDALFERSAGFHRAYAAIALPNDASVALHERYGFRLVGTYREVGRKFDRWWDVASYERSLE